MRHLFFVFFLTLITSIEVNAQKYIIEPGIGFEGFKTVFPDISEKDILVQKTITEEMEYHGIEGMWRFSFYDNVMGLAAVVFESKQKYLLPHDEETEQQQHLKYIEATARIYDEYCEKYGRPVLMKDRLTTREALLFNAEWHYRGHKISLSLHRVGFEKGEEEEESINQMNANWMDQKPYYSLYIHFSALSEGKTEKLPIDKFYISMPYLSFTKIFPALCEPFSISGNIIKTDEELGIDGTWKYLFSDSVLEKTTFYAHTNNEIGRALPEERIENYLDATKKLYADFVLVFGKSTDLEENEWTEKTKVYSAQKLFYASWEFENFTASITLTGDNYGKISTQNLSLEAEILLK